MRKCWRYACIVWTEEWLVTNTKGFMSQAIFRLVLKSPVLQGFIFWSLPEKIWIFSGWYISRTKELWKNYHCLIILIIEAFSETISKIEKGRSHTSPIVISVNQQALKLQVSLSLLGLKHVDRITTFYLRLLV